MRQLRRASPLARIVATLGVLILLQRLAVLRYGAGSRSSIPSCRPPSCTRSGKAVSVDRFILLGIAAALSVGAVGALPLHEVRAGDHRGGREPARRVDRRALARPHRHRSTGRSARRWPAWPRSSSRRSSAAGVDDDEPGAGGDGRRARGQLPVVPDRLRRRRGDRRRPDRARPYVHTPGVSPVAAVRVIVAGDGLPGPGAAAARLLPAAAARRRNRPGPAAGGRGRRGARRRS